MNITPLDWAILAAYLVNITAIGLIVGYRVRHSGEYFLGGRRFGPWLMIWSSQIDQETHRIERVQEIA